MQSTPPVTGLIPGLFPAPLTAAGAAPSSAADFLSVLSSGAPTADAIPSTALSPDGVPTADNAAQRLPFLGRQFSANTYSREFKGMGAAATSTDDPQLAPEAMPVDLPVLAPSPRIAPIGAAVAGSVQPAPTTALLPASAPNAPALKGAADTGWTPHREPAPPPPVQPLPQVAAAPTSQPIKPATVAPRPTASSAEPITPDAGPPEASAADPKSSTAAVAVTMAGTPQAAQATGGPILAAVNAQAAKVLRSASTVSGTVSIADGEQRPAVSVPASTVAASVSAAGKTAAAMAAGDPVASTGAGETLRATAIAEIRLGAQALSRVRAAGVLMSHRPSAAAAAERPPLAADPMAGQSFDPALEGIETAATAEGRNTETASAPRVLERLSIVQLPLMIARNLHQGAQEFRVQLDPQDLGEVDVTLEFQRSGAVRIAITSERGDTSELLQQQRHALMQALEDAGIDGSSVDLSFEQRSRDDTDRARNPNEGVPVLANDAAPDEGQPAPQQTQRLVLSRLFDLEA